MAKVIRSNKSKGIKAKSQKDAKFVKYKLLSKYIVSGGNQKMFNALMKTDKTTLNSLKYRSISQLVMYPKLISYINKYLNHLYDFNNIPHDQWFYTIMMIVKIFGLNHTSQLHFSKFQANERDDFIKTLNAYYNEVGADKLNKSELNALYILYKYGFIQETILISMKEVISGKPQVNKKTEIAPKNQFNIQNDIIQNAVQNSNEVQMRTLDSLSATAKQYVENIKAFISTSNVCKQCEINCKHSVTIDTNMTTLENADLIFIGFMPTRKDCVNNLPFSGGDEAKLFHRFLQPLANKFGLKYVLTNFIFCPLDKTKQLQNKRKVIQNCGQLLDEIIRQFTPKLKVLVGLEATKVANLKGGITKLNGKNIDDMFVLMDPESVIINNKKLKQYEAGWNQLEQHIQENFSQMTSSVSIDQFNIPEQQKINSITNDLTLFDVKVIKDKVIMIMLDKQGRKKYFVQPINFPVYIKKGSYSECINFTDKMDGVIFCTEEERQSLNSKLYREINKCEGV